MERHENLLLKQENSKLRIENMAVKESLRNLICGKCGGEALPAEISTEGQHLRIENAQLKDELNRACALTKKIVCGPLSSLGGTSSPPMLSSNKKLAVRRNGSGSLGNAHSALSMGLDLNNVVSDARPDVSVSRPLMGMPPVGLSFENSMFLELALTATAELIKLAQNDTPLWFRSLEGSGEMLNFGEYMKMITPCFDIKPRASTHGTRATSILNIRSKDLVEVLMNAVSCAISKAPNKGSYTCIIFTYLFRHIYSKIILRYKRCFTPQWYPHSRVPSSGFKSPQDKVVFGSSVIKIIIMIVL